MKVYEKYNVKYKQRSADLAASSMTSWLTDEDARLFALDEPGRVDDKNAPGDTAQQLDGAAYLVCDEVSAVVDGVHHLAAKRLDYLRGW